MIFTSSEQRERSRRFDRYIGSCDHVLRHPDIVRGLGRLAYELRAVNDTAYMPNMKHGILSASRSQKKSGFLSVVPIFDYEEKTILRATHDYLSQLQPDLWSGHEFTSVDYGFTVPARVIDEQVFFENEAMPDSSDDANHLSPNALAITTTLAFKNLDTRIPEYTLSPPVTLLSEDASSQNRELLGAIAVHEHGHAFDRMAGGIVMRTLLGMAASEFRSYGLQEFVMDVHDPGNDSPATLLAHEVRDLRQRGTTRERPYLPTGQWVLDDMKRLGVLEFN